MKILIKNGSVYSSETRSFEKKDILIKDGIIKQISTLGSLSCDTVFDAENMMLIPGLVDIHTHGRSGYDFISSGRDALKKLSESYLASGVTSVMPTLASAKKDSIINSCSLITEISQNTCGADFIGIHLEGRYLNPNKRGAHALNLLAKPDASELLEILDHMPPIRHISAAFELDKDGSFTKTALANGATLGLAHTEATSEEAKAAVANGVTSFTHLFNAMPALHHRSAGAAAVALTNKDVYAELICDGIHISPEMIKLAYMCKGYEKLVLITDSMEATGCEDGEYSIAGMKVYVKDSIALTEEGALAGSTLSMLDAVKNLARFAEIPFGDALLCATLTPAKAIGVDNSIGSIEQGKKADILFLSRDYDILKVMKSGKFYE